MQQQQQQQQQQQGSNSDIVQNGSAYSEGSQGSMTTAPVLDPVYANRSALLPAYRPSPDYEMVMRAKMMQQAQMQVCVCENGCILFARFTMHFVLYISSNESVSRGRTLLFLIIQRPLTH
jgi:hypothetical protein